MQTDLITRGYIKESTEISFGLIAGNLYKDEYKKIETLIKSKNWLFWGPKDIKEKLKELSKKGYEDNSVTMTAKILLK